MFDKFIGKECEAIVVFAGYSMEGGSTPLSITGILESYDDDYIIINTKNPKKNRSIEVKGKSIIPIKALLVLNVAE